ncbi:MAG: beta-eliminating lyase-related protein [Micrococcus sp.]|nr:beta-eliminating lyase-related protein [Micrococcus sp.]
MNGLRSFASDNYAGVHPVVWEALREADADHARAYGDDPITERLQAVVAEQFGEQAFAVPVFNGTGANVVALQSLLPPWGSVICSQNAHILWDEGGAPERVGRTSLRALPTADAKLTPEIIAPALTGFGFVHAVQPSVVEIAQATELGTVYSPDEVRALTDAAHAAGLSVYMDGARLSNAAASLGVSLRAFTTDAGVDVVSYGATKNGGMAAEAVVVLNPEAIVNAHLITGRDLPEGDAAPSAERAAMALGYLRKSSMQLASKQRYVAAQLLALLEQDRGVEIAGQANAMAAELAERVAQVPGITVVHPPQVNMVFAQVEPHVADAVRTRYPFYDWDPAARLVRWMTSWDTTQADLDGFVAALREATGAPSPAQ